MRFSRISAGILIGQLFCAPAFAQSLADRETARSLMDDGDAKRDKGDRQGALKSYEAADALMHVPTTTLEVAKAQAQLGLLLEARETLGRLQRSPAKPNEPAAFVAARKAADQLAADLAARLPSLVVSVTSADPTQPVTVAIDGETIPPAALAAPRKMNPGVHAVVARAGSAERREDVTLAERDARTLTLELRAPSAPPPPPPAASSAPRVLEYGGFGLAIVGIGVGTATGLVSLSKVHDVKDSCVGNHCPPNRQSDIDSAKSLGTVSTIAFLAGGVGVAAGVVGLILARRSSDHVEAVVTPSWLGARGTF